MSVVLDEKAAAKHLGITPSTLAKWRVQREGPVYLRMGRAVRYRLADLDRFMEQSAVHPEPRSVTEAAVLAARHGAVFGVTA